MPPGVSSPGLMMPLACHRQGQAGQADGQGWKRQMVPSDATSNLACPGRIWKSDLLIVIGKVANEVATERHRRVDNCGFLL